MTDVNVMSRALARSGIDLVMDWPFHMTISHTPLGTQRHVEMLEIHIDSRVLGMSEGHVHFTC